MADVIADPKCPFCAIVYGLAEAKVTARWDDALAIVPLNPVTEGHELVIPRHHVPTAGHDPVVTGRMFQYAAELALDRGGAFNLITSALAAATQTVMHLHVHLVPRRADDGLALPWTPELVGWHCGHGFTIREAHAKNCKTKLGQPTAVEPLYRLRKAG